ncbi:hypothetical protein [Psychromicrobium silvestre]|uniref:hypothetical protein n=1 Tax=Psychromicrobium silvestre TaxID=1645614 RepID=UPI001C542F5C
MNPLRPDGELVGLAFGALVLLTLLLLAVLPFDLALPALVAVPLVAAVLAAIRGSALG